MNPLTRNINGVDYPLYRLRNINDQSVIFEQTISNTLDLPNAGPGYEYLPIFIDDYPEFDSNFSTVDTVEQENKGQWEITYVVTDKSKDEILTAVDNARRAQVNKVVPGQDFTETNTIAIAAIIRAAKLPYSPEEQKLVDAVLVQAQKLADNRAKADADKTLVQDGGKPDLEIGWAVAADAAEADAIET